MKRRLNRAYDHMTMSDECTNRIERAIQYRLEQQKQIAREASGSYVQIQAPSRSTGSIWGRAAAAVLLVLTISVSGVALILHLPRQQVPEAASITSQTTATMPVTEETTPEDYYAAATSLPAEQVEAVAAEIRQAILTQDWNALYDYLLQGYQGEDLPLDYWDHFENFMYLNEINPSFLEAIEAESCRNMFCNVDDGIMMGAEGQVWLNEIDGELKIIAINDMLAGWLRYTYCELEDGTIQIEHYQGSETHVVIPSTIDGKPVTRIGDFSGMGSGAFQDWGLIRSVTIPDSVTYIDDRAFRNCAGLERVDVGAGVLQLGNSVFERCPSLTAVCFYGDAPTAGEDVFKESEQVTVYYNEPTNGWLDTWQGRPTASRLGVE